MCNHHCDTTHAWCHLHTHVDGKVVWCGQCVETVVCINTCMVTSLCHTICVSHLISQVCHHPFHHPFAFLSHTPFWCVCVALSSGIHALFVGVDALALASVLLIWDTPCLPSTTACVCGDGVPALPWPCQPLATFLVCFLVCSSSHCFNLH